MSQMGIDLGGIQGLVSQELLDEFDIHPGCKQMGGDGVTQGVQTGFLADQFRMAGSLNKPAQGNGEGQIPAPVTLFVDEQGLGIRVH